MKTGSRKHLFESRATKADLSKYLRENFGDENPDNPSPGTEEATDDSEVVINAAVRNHSSFIRLSLRMCVDFQCP